MNELAGISVVMAVHRPAQAAVARAHLERLGAEDIVAMADPPSLWAAYDEGWRRARHDVVCFLHEDATLEGIDEALIHERLSDGRTGFLGVAGTRVLDETGVWWRGLNTPDQAGRLSGRCGHTDGRRRWITEYGPFGEVVVLDGVLLLATKAVLAAIGGFADPPLDGFDFYDISATFRARLRGYANYTVPVELYHAGIGPPRPEWEANRERFLRKYGAHLPYALAREDAMTQSPAVTPAPSAAQGDGPPVPMHMELHTSRQFISWMAEQAVSLAFSTYQTGKLFLLGLQPDGRLSVFERTFNRAMGLWGDGQTLYLSTLFQLWRFENALPPGHLSDGYDRMFVPQVAYSTGDIDIHDLAVDGTGRLVFVNTLFSCLATVSDRHSFVPLWQPTFISRLAAEDRCHLNGLAMQDGRPAYVTAVSQSDVGDGWRDRRRDGGVVIDVQTDEIVLGGLSMPHSPRWYRGELWVLNAGTGYLGRVDLQSGRFEPLAFIPGYLRGLGFCGPFAVVGSSKPRENQTFSGLELDDNLRAKDAEARCGLYVVDLRTGDMVHWARIEGTIEELYDVVVLPGVRRPMAIGLKTDEIRRTITIGDGQPL
jgi:uncharacterized protein (TIGR03032 family)